MGAAAGIRVGARLRQERAILSQQQLDTIRLRAQQPAFAAVVQRLHADVAWTFQRSLTVPERTAGYYHDFFCPEHAVQLEYNPESPTRHRCPVDGAWFSGEPYDSAWLWSVNYELAQAAFRLALLWQLEGHAKHRDNAATILLRYAERYPDYHHPEDYLPLRGKVTHSMLDESVWVIPMAWAAWFLGDTLAPADATAIRDRLLMPAAEHLSENRLNEVQNAENWVNAALGTIGVVAGEPDLVELALNGPFGFRQQVTEGVLADGAWFEGTASYHFYSLAPMLWQARASENTETELRQTPQLQAMLRVPLQWAYPDLTLPALNDCWYHSSLLDECGHGIPPTAGFYEIGAGWYDEPAFGTLLRRMYRDRPRDSFEALLYGPDELPTEELPRPASVHLAPSDHAILRHWGSEGSGAPYLLLKAGPHGGGHGHPDKLNIVLYANGERYSPSLGTPGYGIGLNDTWYRQTLSHNTVLLDRTSQPPGDGRMCTFRAPEDGAFGVADAEVRWTEPAGPYADAHLRRVLLTGPGYFLDLFLVQRAAPGEIDWVYHNRGELETSIPLGPGDVDAEANTGYTHLSEVQEGPAAGAATFTFAGDGWGLLLALAGGQPTQIIAAQGPYNPASETIPILIRRRRAQHSCFAALFHPYAGKPQVESVSWYPAEPTDGPPVACLVEHSGTRDLWLLATDPDTQFPVAQRPAADQTFAYPVQMQE
ncbi:MAG: hypothetical protein CL878_00520 [Dehalococcoidia bacterium]|nr:hypothetical protein [Dehalococcoidia bacterium]